ncbi:MAG TPA: alpha/beta fold hydrolase, partial [Candidatus Synoicihabitans sp.]|nr:alpha/beta fold hydrolase [Candidatus Synoicihabitans sp.]
TYPREVRIEPVPILVYCHDGPWSRDHPGYDRGPQALAAMGFAVLQVNYRGSGGFGRAHRDALRTGGERVAIDDLLAAVEWVQATHAVSRRRIAILGNGYGGYLALRALQLHPDRFRCAVGINAPADLLRWMNTPATSISFSRDLRSAFFGNDKDRLRAASLTTEPELFKRPVLIVQAEGDTVVPEAQARALRRAMVGASAIEPEVYRLPAEGHARWLPGSYTRVFERLEEFFVQNIFEYTVETGETEVLED